MPGGVGQGPAVAGFINPAQAPDVTIYTHDWTVQPGHSYHYRMSYTISNPLFGVEQANVKPADRDRLAIASPYSAWSAQVDIPSRFKFWVQKFQRNGNNEVTFDLFSRKPGARAAWNAIPSARPRVTASAPAPGSWSMSGKTPAGATFTTSWLPTRRAISNGTRSIKIKTTLSTRKCSIRPAPPPPQSVDSSFRMGGFSRRYHGRTNELRLKPPLREIPSRFVRPQWVLNSPAD